jgi:4-deoxy-L-threo-5-hexosulose-uronate ketol-isomerase
MNINKTSSAEVNAKMKIIRTPDPIRTATLESAELRTHFLLEDLFQPDAVQLYFTDVDRAVVGGVVPASRALSLTGDPILHAGQFCLNRELGILNLGGAGSVRASGESYALANGDCLYLGRGTEDIVLESTEAGSPAEFYLLSYPAQVTHPSKLIKKSDATPGQLGETATANVRTIYKMLHPGNLETCQIVMGYTELAEGSVWNTMPCHTHERRSEVYLYYNLPEDAAVMHFMGEPDQTRHLVVRDKQAVLSPAWSIHSGCGTAPYGFVWGMGGENQTFDDMDWVAVQDLR